MPVIFKRPSRRITVPMMSAATMASSSAELQLMLLLCRFPVLNAEKSALEQLISLVCSQVHDWELFVRLVDHHRIISLILRNAQAHTAALPRSVYEELRARSGHNAVTSFRYLAEVQRLLTMFDDAGIEARVIKGVALSIQAYGDVSTRDVGDIDLLIAGKDAEKADRLLVESSQQGQRFQRTDPAGVLTPKRHAAYVLSFKDFTYQPVTLPGSRQRHGFEVDLHWRLFRNPFMPGNNLAEQSRVYVSAGSIKLPTFTSAVSLLHLSLHGAVDGWTRLKTVADTAALWKGSTKVDQQMILELARKTEVLPYLQSALMLAEHWIGGLDLPHPELSAKGVKLSESIYWNARKVMEETDFLPPLRESSSWKMKRYEASLHSSRRYRLAIVRRVLYRPRVWNRFDLSDRWFHLYPLLSPVEWLLFRSSRSSQGNW